MTVRIVHRPARISEAVEPAADVILAPPPPNDPAQQRRGPSELRISKSLHAPAVCCSAWFGVWGCTRPQRPRVTRLVG